MSEELYYIDLILLSRWGYACVDQQATSRPSEQVLQGVPISTWELSVDRLLYRPHFGKHTRRAIFIFIHSLCPLRTIGNRRRFLSCLLIPIYFGTYCRSSTICTNAINLLPKLEFHTINSCRLIKTH